MILVRAFLLNLARAIGLHKPKPAPPTTLPASGTRVRTAKRLETDLRGFLVVDKHMAARRPNAPGTYLGHVAGHGGDAWWIRHEDGSVGAYLFSEVDVLKRGGAS